MSTNNDSDKKISFWYTLPGVLTGGAAIITAIGGLIATLYAVGVIGTSQTSTAVVPSPVTQHPGSNPQVPSVEPPQTTGDLVAYYPFTGNANDISGQENHGTVTGPYLVEDRHGHRNSAYAFDGRDDSIQVPDSPELHITKYITLSAWVYPTSKKTQEIIRKGPEVNGDTASPYSLGLSASGEIVFSLESSLQFAQLTKRDYPLNKWIHIAGTYDGETMRLYVNGELEDTRSISLILNDNSSPLLIGTRLNLPADTFQGGIDELIA